MKLQLMALLTAALAAVGANAQQSGNATPEKKRASNRLMEEVVFSRKNVRKIRKIFLLQFPLSAKKNSMRLVSKQQQTYKKSHQD